MAVTDGSTAAGIRQQLHGMWAAVAGGWERHAGYADARAAAVTAAMLERTAPRPGDRVLHRPACRVPSRSAIPTGWPTCCARPGSPQWT